MSTDQLCGQNYRLADDEVHVWRYALDWPAESIDQLAKVLSNDEREKASRFRFVEDRHRAIIGRGVLRTLLGRLLAIQPETIRFSYNRYGKPELADGLTSNRIEFNISHSGDWILLGLARNRSVGIDVEQLQVNLDWTSIAANFFSSYEQRALDSVPDMDKAAAFFSCWTRKEAYIKAEGDGLSIPLDQFDVSLAPGQLVRLIETRHAPGEHHLWRLWDIDCGPLYKAALAIKGPDSRLVCWDLPAGQIDLLW